ncbi:M56 family metallopeptidase [uncultured Maribacter sp.]|uniref:M56 family metallopeptidase n=1 Tax=uncultured Maribacter sp. TaxID=431308 RepID=UPI0030DA54D4
MEALCYYILKVSSVLLLFFSCYQLFLRKETLFQFNRFFLLSGLIFSVLFPLLYITNTINASLLDFTDTDAAISTLSESSTINVLNPYSLLISLYLIGVFILFIKLFRQGLDLNRVLQKGERVKLLATVHIKTKTTLQPFSFFNRIVYNPTLHSEKELEAIVAHEEVHVTQFHSLDIILMEVFLIIQWINPIVWLYRIAVKQNLEFLADTENHQIKTNKKAYQYILLQRAVGNHHLSIVNPFFNSLIKKRIIMINQQKSHKLKALKSLLILPFLAVFLVGFNVREVYSYKNISQSDSIQNTIELLIDKNTSDSELLKIKTDLAKDEFDFSYTTVRNKDGEIKNISIEISGGNKKNGEFSSQYNSVSDNDTMDPTYILIDTENNSISFRRAEVTNRVTHIKKSAPGNNKKISISTTNTSTKDYDFKIVEKEGNGFMFITTDGDEEPLFYIDGKKSDAKALKDLAESTIKSMNVIKGDKAIKKYGEEAKHGVIEIITKE